MVKDPLSSQVSMIADSCLFKNSFCWGFGFIVFVILVGWEYLLSDFGVQAELPPLDASPQVAADKAPSAAPDAPLSPSQEAPDEAPL
ncbi:hypothetical protein HNY73_014229 [Argiope bruennichi]|uniref:Uncharacterized protein n=1 Tax=Argiope bruennichi TaxID=94029 RepID=A0A8T0ENJ4_ARGBR|nr:hypothetical protein HNY73_014229 [Argiope bruennichi]